MAAATLPPTILLVDDDPIVRFLVRGLLRRDWAHVRVLEAEDGKQGLALVQAHCQATKAPQSLLVLLDLNMPVMDGLEFLRHYHLLPGLCHQAVTVVVSTTSADTRDIAQAQALVSAWQPKPLRTQDLAQLMSQFLPAALPA